MTSANAISVSISLRYAISLCGCVCISHFLHFILLNGFKNSRDELPRNDICMHARSDCNNQRNWSKQIDINWTEATKCTQHTHYTLSIRSNTWTVNKHTFKPVRARASAQCHKKVFNLIRISSINVKHRMEWKREYRELRQNHYHQLLHGSSSGWHRSGIKIEKK